MEKDKWGLGVTSQFAFNQAFFAKSDDGGFLWNPTALGVDYYLYPWY